MQQNYRGYRLHKKKYQFASNVHFILTILQVGYMISPLKGTQATKGMETSELRYRK